MIATPGDRVDGQHRHAEHEQQEPGRLGEHRQADGEAKQQQ